MNISRKEFLALASLTALSGCKSLFDDESELRHRSDYKGIQIGVITYSYRSMKCGAANVLEYAIRSGLGTVELMGGDAEEYVGITNTRPKNADEKAALLKARLAVKDEKWLDLKARYDAVGMQIHIVKFGAIGANGVSDEENDYYCRVAKLLGANIITREIPKPEEYETVGRRCAAIADRNGVRIAFHNHTQINATTYDGPLLGYSKNLAINFDIGHYVAANDDDPLKFVEKYHDRIASIHVKDRTSKAHGQKNLAFGKGDTPLNALFALLVDRKWDIPCDIELEYAIPVDSDAVEEVLLCNSYCKRAIEKKPEAK